MAESLKLDETITLLKGGAISALLNKVQDIAQQDLKGNSALIWCADAGQVRPTVAFCRQFGFLMLLQVDAVKLLLECKSDINRQGISGNTALMRAARNGHFECAELLLKNGANPSIFNTKQQVGGISSKLRHSFE